MTDQRDFRRARGGAGLLGAGGGRQLKVELLLPFSLIYLGACQGG